ncbi:MAG: hypothetical protein SNG45_05040, partial [Rikenellaceae bacterium]
ANACVVIASSRDSEIAILLIVIKLKLKCICQVKSNGDKIIFFFGNIGIKRNIYYIFASWGIF